MKLPLSQCKGLYLQYVGGAKPVVPLNRVTYAFISEDRTCLVEDAKHLQYLLMTGQYRVVGVEVEDVNTGAPDKEEGAPPVAHGKTRGRPRRTHASA